MPAHKLTAPLTVRPSVDEGMATLPAGTWITATLIGAGSELPEWHVRVTRGPLKGEHYWSPTRPACEPPVVDPRKRASGPTIAESARRERGQIAIKIRLSDAQVVALDALRSVRGESRAGSVHRIVSAALESVSASMRVAK